MSRNSRYGGGGGGLYFNSLNLHLGVTVPSHTGQQVGLLLELQLSQSECDSKDKQTQVSHSEPFRVLLPSLHDRSALCHFTMFPYNLNHLVLCVE